MKIVPNDGCLVVKKYEEKETVGDIILTSSKLRNAVEIVKTSDIENYPENAVVFIDSQTKPTQVTGNLFIIDIFDIVGFLELDTNVGNSKPKLRKPSANFSLRRLV